MKQPNKYCAIYTRKSSEEGLEQGFNSLDAQREACLAYITSQKAEGWTAVREEYSDGGFSGGNLERPALRKLLDDVKAGKVNIIVVYKIDRLTRSLMDFAKLVEIFDAHGVTFVSVTQSFNTTTSMGRLTLNVLLSFAQFEREVAGERIRDKISASKRKGIWMGGTVPLGYDIQNRSLVINEKEAATIRLIYDQYLALGCVRKLKSFLDDKGVKTKAGFLFSRGVLYWLLQNPVYIGKTRHRNQLYDGQHKSIVSLEIWNSVQEKLRSQARRPRGQKGIAQHHLLQGLLFDTEGTVYSPTFTNKKGRRYRYYVSQNKVQFRDHPKHILSRFPAEEIESFVEQAIREKMEDPRFLRQMLSLEEADPGFVNFIATKGSGLLFAEFLKGAVHRIVLDIGTLTIEVSISNCIKLLEEELKVSIPLPLSDVFPIVLPFNAKKSWRGAIVLEDKRKIADPLDLPPNELRDLVRGIVWRDEHFSGANIRQIAKREGHSEVFVGKLIHRTFELV